MEEVEMLCDRIAIVDHGRVIAEGSVAELQALVGDEDRIRVSLGEAEGLGDAKEEAAAEAAMKAVQALPSVSCAEIVGGTIEVLTPDAAPVLGDVITRITAAGAHVRAVEIAEPNLESVFLHLTGRGLRD
jgi:ABC-2 type transport system ATP-binding protein